ncbi:MAG TPA: hypothetical protein VJZ27_17805 [Aggregatilineales bacterium]|nr:hypothetical protein [Aggregatilineales bacterium]
MPSEPPVRRSSNHNNRNQSKRAKLRDMSDIPIPVQPAGKSGTFGLAVFGGVFTWLGMMAMVVGAFLTVISSIQLEEDRLADSNVLVPMAALGASLFILGMLFEIPDAEGVERLLLLATIVGGVISGFFLVLGAIYVDFFAGILATLFSLAVVITYFSVKGFG